MERLRFLMRILAQEKNSQLARRYRGTVGGEPDAPGPSGAPGGYAGNLQPGSLYYGRNSDQTVHKGPEGGCDHPCGRCTFAGKEPVSDHAAIGGGKASGPGSQYDGSGPGTGDGH